MQNPNNTPKNKTKLIDTENRLMVARKWVWKKWVKKSFVFFFFKRKLSDVRGPEIALKEDSGKDAMAVYTGYQVPTLALVSQAATGNKMLVFWNKS